jgi:hypothetical protein
MTQKGHVNCKWQVTVKDAMQIMLLVRGWRGNEYIIVAPLIRSRLVIYQEWVYECDRDWGWYMKSIKKKKHENV